MLQAGAYGIVQPDASFIGMTSAYRVARMYHRAGLPCIPHSWTNAIAHATNAHLVAAIPNRVMLETQHIGNPHAHRAGGQPHPGGPGLHRRAGAPRPGDRAERGSAQEYPFTENGIFVPWPR